MDPLTATQAGEPVGAEPTGGPVGPSPARPHAPAPLPTLTPAPLDGPELAEVLASLDRLEALADDLDGRLA